MGCEKKQQNLPNDYQYKSVCETQRTAGATRVCHGAEGSAELMTMASKNDRDDDRDERQWWIWPICHHTVIISILER